MYMEDYIDGNGRPVEVTPMTSGDYNKYCGFPFDTTDKDDGYLIIYKDGSWEC